MLTIQQRATLHFSVFLNEHIHTLSEHLFYLKDVCSMLGDARRIRLNINEHIQTLSKHLFYLKDVCSMLDDARRIKIQY